MDGIENESKAMTTKSKSTRKKSTQKKTGGESAGERTSTRKPAARNKTAARKPATKKVTRKASGATKDSKKNITGDERRRMVAEAAYYLAEGRGFAGGDPKQDWLDAEADVDAALMGVKVRKA